MRSKAYASINLVRSTKATRTYLEELRRGLVHPANQNETSAHVQPKENLY
jgi:hypothetical protein